jgi:trk system potassium uptake protein TrkA
MKILILGAGQVGRTAADHLSREEANEVTVVDVNEDTLRDVQDRFDVRTVAGNAAHPNVLEAAGAAEAEIIVALTSSDEVNLMACEVAFTLFRTPTKIARIRAAEYTSRAGLFGADGLSVDVFISPEQLVTEYVERLIHHPGTLQVLDFADGRVRLVGVRIRSGGLLAGHSLRELPQHLPKTEVRVVAIYRDGRSVAAEGDTALADGDEVFFLAARDDIRRIMSTLRHDDSAARRIVIAGGGNIGFHLARTLEKHNQVKVIERDARRARKVAELLESAIVLHGDAADEELLIEENIDSADVFAAMTNAEEANILSAMLAKRLGAHKVMALINKPSYAELMESHPAIDIAISPQTITIGSLLAHVRRGDVVRVHALKTGAAEALEAVARGDERTSRVVGRTVAQIALPEGASIGAIVRGDQVIMAHHDTLVLADDHVILFLADRRHLEAVERLFVRSPR